MSLVSRRALRDLVVRPTDLGDVALWDHSRRPRTSTDPHASTLVSTYDDAIKETLLSHWSCNRWVETKLWRYTAYIAQNIYQQLHMRGWMVLADRTSYRVHFTYTGLATHRLDRYFI